MDLWLPPKPAIIVPRPAKLDLRPREAMFTLNQLAGFGYAGGYSLRNSLGMVAASSQTISRSSIASLNTRKCTLAFWVKLTNIGVRKGFFATGTAGTSPGHQFETNGSGTNDLNAFGYSGSYSVSTASGILADTNWHHLCYAFDTDHVTAASRLLLYLDGVLVTLGSTITLNTNLCSATDTHTFGNKPSISIYMNGRYADIHFINGQQLLPSDFINGTGAGSCSPKQYIGTYPAGSYHLKFDNADLTDDSGNGLTFTNNNSCTFSTDVPV